MKDKNLTNNYDSLSLEELTNEANKMIEDLENQKDLENSIEKYQDLLKLNNIIEKKFQQVSGSVCEKIQTYDFKMWQYQRTFPSYNIVYIYCLSEWFKTNCKAELEYFEYRNVPLFWGNSPSYKNDIIHFMNNYK